MADIDITISRQFEVNASPEESFAFLADTPATLEHYPKLKKLVDLGDDCWRWELTPTGIKGFSHQVVYSVRYRFEAAKGVISWTPIQGAQDNADIRGQFDISAHGKGSKVRLDTDGSLQVSLPGLLAGAIKPVVMNEFAGQIDDFIKNLKKVLG